MDWLCSRWRFDKCLTVDGIGEGGGLVFLWFDEEKVEVKSFSKHYIDELGTIIKAQDGNLQDFMVSQTQTSAMSLGKCYAS